MDINTGEYVRTKNQGIFIISHINKNFNDSDFKKVCMCQNEKVAFTNIDTIKELKHSKNIIDLIEVGDWAIMNCYGLIIKKVITQDDIWELKTKEYQLLKILTKERFNSESYEV